MIELTGNETAAQLYELCVTNGIGGVRAKIKKSLYIAAIELYNHNKSNFNDDDQTEFDAFCEQSNDILSNALHSDDTDLFSLEYPDVATPDPIEPLELTPIALEVPKFSKQVLTLLLFTIAAVQIIIGFIGAQLKRIPVAPIVYIVLLFFVAAVTAVLKGVDYLRIQDYSAAVTAVKSTIAGWGHAVDKVSHSLLTRWIIGILNN